MSCYDDTPPLARTLFVFFRTALALEFEQGALKALAEILPEPPMLGLGPKGLILSNGPVLRLKRQIRPPFDTARALNRALDKLEAWAIHECYGEFEENPKGGPLSRYFDANPPGIPFSQIFVLARKGDAKYEQTVVQLRSRMKAPCTPVFHFRDGQIMMLRSKESGTITKQRCADQLRLQNWVIVDSSGVSCSSVGETKRIWQPCGRDDIDFTDDAA